MSSSWSGRRTRHQTDANHASVMALLRKLCPVVEDHSQGGHGYDLLVGTASGNVYAVEVKDGTKPPSERKLSDNERKAAERWGWRYKVVLSFDDAIRLART